MKRMILIMMLVGLATAGFGFQSLGDVESRGVILEVSVEEATVTLEEGPEPILNPQPPGAMQSGVVREFVVNDATKLTMDGESVELTDVQAGVPATIVYRIEDGKNIAKSIELQTPTTD